MNSRLSVFLTLFILASGCAGNTNRDVWQNIDYAKIARENQARENDINYMQPTVLGCVDDDLYNCTSRRGAYR